MKFQAFHMNPGEKLKKKDVNNDLSNFMSVFPNKDTLLFITITFIVNCKISKENPSLSLHICKLKSFKMSSFLKKKIQ